MAGAARRALAVAVAAMVVMCAGVAAAAVYEVGDKAGWTIMNSPDYGKWANSKKFHLGDTIVFTYMKQFHNVMAVSEAGYKNCDTSKPIATWSTGNDSVVLNTTGPHYFLCGFPGHCAAGQKVAINVLGSSAAPSESPSMAPSPAGSSGSEPSAPGGSGSAAAAAPSPHGNAAPRTVGGSAAATLAASVLSLVAAAVLA